MLAENARVTTIAVVRVPAFAWVLWAWLPTVWCEEGQVTDAYAMGDVTEEEP